MRFDHLTNYLLQTPTWLQSEKPDTAVSKYTSYWDGILATPHFEWNDCYGDFKCARLQVPMDWQGGSKEAGKTVELAVIKVEATVPVTDPRYGGAVVLNPGGPGGSGIGQVLRGGHAVRTLLSAGSEASPDTAKHFDIIGFDPRGVNNTRPILLCYPDRLAEAAASIEKVAHGIVGSSDTSFDNLWALRQAEGKECSRRSIEGGIGKHMNTAPVARDIIEISERHGEWREAQAKRLLASGATEESNAALERTAYQPGAEMVQYWGFSYGTILGATLSAMYPERIKRAVLDGVADSHDYMAGGWTTNLRDTDLLFVKIASYCYDGGPSNCPIYHKDGPAVISGNMQQTLLSLRENPLPVLDVQGKGPMIATYDDFKVYMREVVYNPLTYFPETTQILYDLSQGNGSSLAVTKLQSRAKLDVPVPEQCEKDGPYSPSCFTPEDHGHTGGATSGIACSDAAPSRLGQTKEEYRKYAKKIAAQSHLIGESWSSIQMPCTAWEARPHWRYDGNFHNKTAHPILFAGNTIDPVTPVFNAFLMSEGFEGAGVLHQDSEGHCTYASPSMCTGRALREYFQTGELPGKPGGLKEWDEWGGHGLLCEPDRLPLDGYTKNSDAPLPVGETDAELWNALVELNRVWP